MKKESAAFDLPIAVACMMAGGQLVSEKVDELLLLGELALDGRLRPVRGGLASAMLAAEQKRRGIILPADNAAEAAGVDRLCPCDHSGKPARPDGRTCQWQFGRRFARLSPLGF